jgi:hypothetical protein
MKQVTNLWTYLIQCTIYSCNVCHWVLQLLMMVNVDNEGDITRLKQIVMYTMAFFFSHSRLSINPMQQLQLLEDIFTNIRCGIGNNIE